MHEGPLGPCIDSYAAENLQSPETMPGDSSQRCQQNLLFMGIGGFILQSFRHSQEVGIVSTIPVPE